MTRIEDRRTDVDYPRRAVATFGADPRTRDVGPLRHFARKYGWRAYALPVLVVITIVALVSAGNSGPSSSSGQDTSSAVSAMGDGTDVTTTDGADGPDGGASAEEPSPPVASGNTSLKDDVAGDNADATILKAGALPAGAAYTAKGAGTFKAIPGMSAPVGKGRLYKYVVEVENGVTGVDAKAFASEIEQVLSDKRSWAGHGDVQLQRVDSGTADFHVSLTSVETTRKICGYTIPVETSCYMSSRGNSSVNRVVMNVARWVRGSAAYLGDLSSYRIYMINHENGHAMGHQHAHECLPDGLAPVMMQQTIGLKSAADGTMCQANPWPYPAGVKGVPGHEEADTYENSEFGLTGGD